MIHLFCELCFQQLLPDILLCQVSEKSGLWSRTPDKCCVSPIQRFSPDKTEKLLINHQMFSDNTHSSLPIKHFKEVEKLKMSYFVLENMSWHLPFKWINKQQTGIIVYCVSCLLLSFKENPLTPHTISLIRKDCFHSYLIMPMEMIPGR